MIRKSLMHSPLVKAWVIARREYLALVGTKSFWLALLMPPLMAVLGVLVALSEPTLQRAGSNRILLIDHSSSLGRKLAPVMKEAGLAVDESPELRASWRAQLEQGKLFAVVEVPAQVDERHPVHLFVENVASSRARKLNRLVQEAMQRQRLAQAGLAERDVERLMHPVDVTTEPPPSRKELGSSESGELGLLFPLVAALFIVMGVMSGAMPLLQAVVEEKQQRISEVLLGAVTPATLMAGKLLGTTAAGLTILGCNLALGLGVLTATGLTQSLPLLAVAVAVLVSVAAMLMYGALFLALGAASSELKEAQGLLTPAMVLFLSPMVALPILAETPNHPFAVALSLFPWTAPLAMPVRLGVTHTVPVWQVSLCCVLMVLATALTVWAAGRVFRIGILSQGRLPRLRELLRWVLTG